MNVGIGVILVISRCLVAWLTHIPDVKQTKLDKKAEKSRFVGYSTQMKGYRLLDEKTLNVVIR